MYCAQNKTKRSGLVLYVIIKKRRFLKRNANGGMGKIRTVYLCGGGQRGVSLSLSLRMATQRMAFYFCVFVYIFLGTMMTPAPRLNETKNELIIKI